MPAVLKVLPVAPKPAGLARPSAWHLAGLFALILACEIALHAPLLRLPYFWDEAGYYIPAARDLLLTGDLIPHSTLSNAHPPLLMAWLALAWKIAGFSPLITRLAMLVVAAFALTGIYRLARLVASEQVAYATVICTAMYPVFFAQSSLAHLDLAATALVIWALSFYLEERILPSAALFALACLTKETAVIAPAALIGWELAGAGLRWWSKRSPRLHALLPEVLPFPSLSWQRLAALALSVVPLVAWFFYHRHRTGYFFGNPEFLQYNLLSTLHPLRFLSAVALRFWHLFGYLNMFVLTGAALLAMKLLPIAEPAAAVRKIRGNGHPLLERPRIAIRVQLIFAALVLAHVLALSILGGAVLARYLLPVYPFVVLVSVSTLWRRLPWWPAFLGVVCLGFVIGLLVNPPYRFAPEDNLAYADYVRLHQSAAERISNRYPSARVLTAWPASDELFRPWLGYVERPIKIVKVENFAAGPMLAAARERDLYDLALVFSTKYEPDTSLQSLLPFWEHIQERWFGYHRDLTPEAAAGILSGRILYQASKSGQWVAIIAVEHAEYAGLRRNRR